MRVELPIIGCDAEPPEREEAEAQPLSCEPLQAIPLTVAIAGTAICPGCPPGILGISARFTDGNVNGTHDCYYDATLGLWTAQNIATATFVNYDDNECTGEILSIQTISFTIWVSCGFGRTFDVEIKGSAEPPYGTGAPYDPSEGGFQAFQAVSLVGNGSSGDNIFQCGEDSMGNINGGTATLSYTL